jgi:formylglycine-generating enzyme required for sulfatase activity
MRRWFILLIIFSTLSVMHCGQDQDAQKSGENVPTSNMDSALPNYMTPKIVEREIDVDALPATIKDFHGIEYVLIRPGEFSMGSETGDLDESPVHTVQFKYPYYIGKYEVTQKQWASIMGENPSIFKGDNLPVETVSWDNIQAFVRKLNKFEKGNLYRLPTEEEWEYAALAGTVDGGVSQLNRIAWHEGNSREKSHRVGQKAPNAWGIYDMFGNVWEWCHNAYAPYRGSDMVMEDGFRVINGGHATNNIVKDNRVLFRVFRGGSWMVPSTLIRPANREKRNADYAFDNVGFRLMKKVN